MYGALTTAEYLRAFSADADLVRQHLTDGSDLAAPVRGCPGWTVLDVVGHLGVVHRWTLDSLASSTPPSQGSPAGRAEIADWFAAGAAALHDALRDSDPDRPCWGFGPEPRTVRFWVRRQALETAVHAWDVGEALGRPPAVDPELAADGVEEVTGMFYPRQVRLGRREPVTAAVAFAPTDVTGTSVLGEGDAVATLRGRAEDLFLGMWGRRDLLALVDRGDVALDGDSAAARHVLAEQVTP